MSDLMFLEKSYAAKKYFPDSTPSELKDAMTQSIIHIFLIEQFMS